MQNISKLESARLENLLSYDILDTVPEEPFDRITRLAKYIFEAPVALVSLVDGDRQWFNNHIMDYDGSICRILDPTIADETIE